MNRTQRIYAEIENQEKSLKELYEALPDVEQGMVRCVVNRAVKAGTVERTKRAHYLMKTKAKEEEKKED